MYTAKRIYGQILLILQKDNMEHFLLEPLENMTFLTSGFSSVFWTIFSMDRYGKLLCFPHITVGFLFSSVASRRLPPRPPRLSSSHLTHISSHTSHLTPLISHTSHLTPLTSHYSSHTHLISHHSSHTTHLTHHISHITSHTQLISHNSSHIPFISHHSSHRQLISFISHTTHLTHLISHISSSHRRVAWQAQYTASWRSCGARGRSSSCANGAPALRVLCFGRGGPGPVNRCERPGGGGQRPLAKGDHHESRSSFMLKTMSDTDASLSSLRSSERDELARLASLTKARAIRVYFGLRPTYLSVPSVRLSKEV